LRLYNKLQKTVQFGTKPFDVDYFGVPGKLRLFGVGLVAIGRFMILSFFAVSFNHFR